ncbi:hypothetical protein [Acinetobacter faecalis]|uniref:hypothetical protein n=1 Tax=Acinetobacter faecalis TaxID=2665161 RepID=UPI002A9112E2|nr:hypothetical protein [Acinetobacter faecalis]MDY6458630.1 hypothetical protein [Acinetobacter faecalis]MDY6483710.1 hypothetical protein [Acinetobacter faecalis]MDY6530051.1 hypothetical protein [Acinetobacter faecalis]
MNERSSKFAVWMTILWLGGIFSFYILGLFERPESFNELGDFLAGVFAPVAFLWLIYGYFQNSEALQAQIKEMSDGVKQQAQLVNLQREQLESQKKVLKPFISIDNIKLKLLECDSHEIRVNKSFNNLFVFEITFEVKNADVRAIGIYNSNDKVLYEVDFIGKNELRTMPVVYKMDEIVVNNDRVRNRIIIKFKDSFENEYCEEYILCAEMDSDHTLFNIHSPYCYKA